MFIIAFVSISIIKTLLWNVYNNYQNSEMKLDKAQFRVIFYNFKSSRKISKLMKTFKYTSCVSFSNVPATLQEILLNTKCKLFLFCFSGGPVVKKPFAMQKSQV